MIKTKINIKTKTETNEKNIYKFFPKNKNELKSIINQQINKYGDSVDLNNIDVSQITDMSYLFWHLEFNGNISNWNVSNVKEMFWMFTGTKFNQNISKWDVSNVRSMDSMFYDSNFNGDISN